MKLHRMNKLEAVAVAGLLMTYGGCGGGSASPTSPATPIPTSPPPVSSSPTPPPNAAASVDAVCRSIGYGTPKAGCDHVEVATMLPLVESAIDMLVKARPEIFDVTTQIGDGGYRVLDEKAYLAGMQTTLAGLGICSQPDGTGTNLIMKNENELDETYAVLNSKGFVRRGWGSYLKSCIPSSFPLSPEDQFSYVRVAFFGIGCEDPNVPKPIPAAGTIPVVCTGIVTATPKDANGFNTPENVHGQDIQWRLRSGGDVIAEYEPADLNIFNRKIQALKVGTFSLCATVGGKEGCLNGQVTPYP